MTPDPSAQFGAGIELADRAMRLAYRALGAALLAVGLATYCLSGALY